MMTVEELDNIIQYTHSVKISDTAKGIRVDVHVYTTDLDTAVTESVKLYQDTRKLADKEKIPLAPMEAVNGKQ